MPKHPIVYSSIAISEDERETPSGVRYAVDPTLLDDEPAGSDSPTLHGRVVFACNPRHDPGFEGLYPSCRMSSYNASYNASLGFETWQEAITWLLEGDNR